MNNNNFIKRIIYLTLIFSVLIIKCAFAKDEGYDYLSQENDLKTALSGKHVSILGDSISTYQNYNNNTTYNNTIGSNAVYGTTSIWASVNNTYWMTLINKYGMDLLVNNSWSGGTLYKGASCTQGYVRSRNLHDNVGTKHTINTSPDIVLMLGVNDRTRYKDTGSMSDINQSNYTTDSYTPTSWVDCYAYTLATINRKYPGVHVFCMGEMQNTRFPSAGVKVDTETDRKNWNSLLSQVCDLYDYATYLECYDSPDGDENFDWIWKMRDTIHPNVNGHKAFAESIGYSFVKKYLSETPHIKVSEINDLVFTNNCGINSNGYYVTASNTASSDQCILSVNGGETLYIHNNEYKFAVFEFDEDRNFTGDKASSYYTNSHTLNSSTKFVKLAFKKIDGTAISDSDLQLMNNFVSFSEKYRTLNYIEGTGTQYINTNYNMTNTQALVSEWKNTVTTSNDLYGADASGTYYLTVKSGATQSWNLNKTTKTVSNTSTDKYTIQQLGTWSWIDDKYTKDFGSSSGTNAKIHIFKNGASGSSCGKGKLYKFTIHSGVSAKNAIDYNLNLRPVVLTSDISSGESSDSISHNKGEIGLWDLKNNMFYPNVGTGEFSCEESYNVTYNLNGHGTAIATKNYKIGKKIDVSDPTDSKYTFDGWYLDSAFSLPFNKDYDQVLGNITLYAKWEGGGGGEIVDPALSVFADIFVTRKEIFDWYDGLKSRVASLEIEGQVKVQNELRYQMWLRGMDDTVNPPTADELIEWEARKQRERSN